MTEKPTRIIENKLLDRFNSEIAEIGGVDAMLLKIMSESPNLYYAELKQEFRRLGWSYSIKKLAILFNVTESLIRYWRKEIHQRPIYKRRAKRKTNRLFVTILDTETGIYYDQVRIAALSHNIPMGSSYSYFVNSMRFLRLLPL